MRKVIVKANTIKLITMNYQKCDFYTDDFGAVYSDDGKILFKGPKNVSFYAVKEGTEIIAEAAFKKNWELAEVSLPSSLRLIEFEAFHGCERLKEINLPEGLVEIKTDAFFKCINLTSLKFPDSLEYFNGAFDYCPFLSEITISRNRKEPYSWNLGVGTPYPIVRYEGETDEELKQRQDKIKEQLKRKNDKLYKIEEDSPLSISILLPHSHKDNIIKVLHRLGSKKLLEVLNKWNTDDLAMITNQIGPEESAFLIHRLMKICQLIDKDIIPSNDGDELGLYDDTWDDFDFNEGYDILEGKEKKSTFSELTEVFKTPEEEFFDFFSYYPVKEMPGSGPSYPAYDKDGNLILNI